MGVRAPTYQSPFPEAVKIMPTLRQGGYELRHRCLLQGSNQFNLRHRLNCSMDVTVQCMTLARSHGSLVDLLSTRLGQMPSSSWGRGVAMMSEPHWAMRPTLGSPINLSERCCGAVVLIGPHAKQVSPSERVQCGYRSEQFRSRSARDQYCRRFSDGEDAILNFADTLPLPRIALPRSIALLVDEFYPETRDLNSHRSPLFGANFRSGRKNSY
ncbi:hypothetical protein HZ326_24551 [Fusarium oxysporum f. sp. albedinis]|nr:hypothetical protein HZ326_24551 [Fusarium oxysporum f. sp. albedinis]